MIIYKATIKMLSHLIPGIVVVGIGILILILVEKINDRNKVLRHKPKR